MECVNHRGGWGEEICRLVCKEQIPAVKRGQQQERKVLLLPQFGKQITTCEFEQ